MFNESVRYFIRRGSRVHCSALDASKALRLDKVLHFGLFYKNCVQKYIIYVYYRLGEPII